MLYAVNFINILSILLDNASWNFILRGADVYDKSDQPRNPLAEHLSETAWNMLYAFELHNGEKFEGL